MASGSTISLTGGTTMTQVVAGVDAIQAADFNNARTNINAMLNTATDVELGSYTAANTYGYTQGGTSVGAATISELIYADNASGGFKRLQDDVQSLCAFLGQSVRSGVGTDVTTLDTVTAATWNNLMLNIKDCWDNRFSPAVTTVSTEDTVTFGDPWSISLEQETTWTWASESECRAFFNAGGGVGANSTRTSGSVTAQNTAWSDLLSSMGNVFMKHNSTTGSTGTGAGVGFYNLTTSYQLLYTKFGSGAYVNNFFKVEGKVNSVTNPTVVFLKYTWSEQYGNNIDGTVTLNSVLLQPESNGSTISVTAGTGSAGEISSSGVLAPVYVIVATSDNVDEGNAVTLDVTTTNFGNGTLYWSVLGTGASPTSNSDFVANTGNVTMLDDSGSFDVTTVADATTEGAETFVVQLRTDSVSGNVVATSNVITVNDTSLSPPTYNITPDSFSVDEGNTVTVSVVTTDFGNGTLYWTANSSGTGAANVSSDLTASSGNVTVTGDTGSFVITTVADSTTEGAETFFVELRTDSVSGNIVATSNVITIVDTSTSAPTFAVSAAANTVNENANITFNVTTTDFGNGTLYWTTNGDTESADFVESSGNVVITSDAGSFIITTVADLTTEGAEVFFVELRTDSISGNIVATSSNVTIVDTSTTPATYVITPTVNEGESTVFNVTTTNFGSGTLYWSIVGTGDNPASNADFVSSDGSFSVTSDAGSFTVTTVADLTTEGSETFAVQLRTDSVSGNVVATSATLSINDTSTTPPTYTVTANISSVNEGNSVTFNVATTDFGNGVLYWDTIYADSADFDQANGNVVVTTNVGSFTVTTVADLTTEGAEVFAVQLRTDSISGNVVATSGNVTIVDTSTTPVPTYSIIPTEFDVDEGNTLTVNVITTNFGNGDLYWTISDITTDSSDFTDVSGTVPVVDNSGSFEVYTVADDTTEGAETFVIQLRTVDVEGNVVATSNVITINDTSLSPPTYNISPSANTVNENASITLNITTTDFGNGTLYWTANGTGANAANVSSDLVESNSNVTITDDSGSFIITAVADLTTEGAETFIVELRTDSISGNIVANTEVITIVDTSTTPFTYSITPVANTVNEGNSVVFDVTTTEVGNATLYWTVAGDADANDFVASNGNVIITNDVGNLTVTTVEDLTTEGSETFFVELRTDSVSGTVVANSNVVTIVDTSLTPPGPMDGVVVLHGFGPPGASTEIIANQFWRIDESGSNNDIVATGTTGYRFYNSSDATFIDDANIGTTTSNVLFGSGTFARLGTGTSSFANIAHSDDFIFSNAFTVECWARSPAASINYGGLVSKWGLAGEGISWLMYMKANQVVEARLSLDGSNTALTLTGNVTRTPNTWQHYVLERNDDDLIRLYLDGTIIAENTLSGTLFNNDPAPLLYGGGLTTTSVASGWRIDEVRITKDKAQYNGAFTPPTQPHARANVSNVSASISNTFIKTSTGSGERLLTSDTVTFSATGGDGTGTAYGYIFVHELTDETGPNITLSNTVGNVITVSATADTGNVATANVVTIALDPTGFSTTITNPVILTWDGVSLSSDYTVSDAQLTGDSISAWKLTNSGDVTTTTQSVGELDVGDWITPKSEANSSYEVRANVVVAPSSSGVLVGTTGTWLDLGSDRSWSLTMSSGGGFDAVTLFVEIRLDGNVLTSSNVTLDVDSSS